MTLWDQAIFKTTVTFRSPRRVPRDAAAAELAGDLVLQRPLAQVHHVRSLVDPHHAVCRAGGQHQAHVFGGKLHISH